jgi:hypothetical protein
MEGISGNKGDVLDRAWASEHLKEGTEHAKEGVARRISTLGRPKLISRQRGLPVARQSFRHYGTCTSLSARTTLTARMTLSSTRRSAVYSPIITSW